MKHIYDKRKLQRYLDKAQLTDIFDKNNMPTIELFFFEKNEYLIKEGQTSKYLYFLVDGECKCFSFTQNGQNVSFGGTKSFRMFGEVASIWGKEPTSSVQAVKNSYCLAIDLDKHREQILNDNCFLRYLASVLADKIKMLDNTIASYTNSTVANRLASFILQNSIDDVFTCTLISCADIVGASYRHILRTMQSFCDDNLLRKEKKVYYIIDKPALQKIASDTFGYYE